ncbi:hypothetical protein HNP86_001963 [Methanococcus maripaludis]|uniref:Uncharacterized protein n=1 Tax=Methanococcus maripaludis TaxID=39152 RepID=A0A7J9NX21_METMI|nr:hypothetical protein [Methanococcus maripaludis]MBA2851804.1 hypothetical protein [Methanococcus maripaludis]
MVEERTCENCKHFRAKNKKGMPEGIKSITFLLTAWVISVAQYGWTSLWALTILACIILVLHKGNLE